MKTNLLLLATIAGLALGGVTGCKRKTEAAHNTAAAARPAGSNLIRVGYSALTPIHCAIGEVFAHTDILEKHGFSKELTVFMHGKDQHKAGIKGVVDATFTCEVPAMFHLHRLPDLVLTGTPGEMGEMGLVVLKDSPIKSVQELGGKSVAVLGGPSSELLLEQWLTEAGLRLEEHVRMSMHRGRGESVIEELKSGEAAAGVLWDPWLALAQSKHELRVVARAPLWSLLAEHDGHLTAEQQKRYMAAVQAALAYAAQNLDQVSGWVSKTADIPREVVATVLKKNTSLKAGADLKLHATLKERLDKCEAFVMTRRLVSQDFKLSQRIKEPK